MSYALLFGRINLYLKPFHNKPARGLFDKLADLQLVSQIIWPIIRQKGCRRQATADDIDGKFRFGKKK